MSQAGVQNDVSKDTGRKNRSTEKGEREKKNLALWAKLENVGGKKYPREKCQNQVKKK